MSYGLSVVIIEPKDSNNVPFIFIGGFDGMLWHLNKDEPRRD